jgi:hypothetical protein
MKRISPVLSLVLLIIAADSARAVVGYVNFPFNAGTTLFNNPLARGGNNLSQVISPAAPAGMSVWLWNSSIQNFDISSVWDGAHWSADLALPPGTGAALYTPAPFTNTFVGEVVSRDGRPYEDPYTYGPPYSGPNGIYLLGDKLPVGGGDVFMRVLGRNPNEGEQVIYNNGSTYTWLSGGWDQPTEPTLAPCEAAWFNIGPTSFTYVPEPSTAALAFLGLAVLVGRRRA